MYHLNIQNSYLISKKNFGLALFMNHLLLEQFLIHYCQYLNYLLILLIILSRHISIFLFLINHLLLKTLNYHLNFSKLIGFYFRLILPMSLLGLTSLMYYASISCRHCSNLCYFCLLHVSVINGQIEL